MYDTNKMNLYYLDYIFKSIDYLSAYYKKKEPFKLFSVLFVDNQ